MIQSLLYPEWPQIEFRLRILWNEERKRLKLSVPTVFPSPRLLCEVPGGAAVKPGDGREQVHGRWLLLEGGTRPEGQALGLAHTGMHGFDSREGEIRLSVLRSAAYCHEREFDLDEHPAAKYMDQGAHDFKIVVTAGTAEDLRTRLPGLADWLDAPPLVFPHLPAGRGEFLFLDETLPGNLRILFGTIFSPLAFLMGVPWAEAGTVGNLLGIKITANEFVAYLKLSQLVSEGTLSERSITIATYALCGFANFGSIGIQLGGIGSLAPGRRSELAKVGLKAMFGGALASWMTATIAGILFSV